MGNTVQDGSTEKGRAPEAGKAVLALANSKIPSFPSFLRCRGRARGRNSKEERERSQKEKEPESLSTKKEPAESSPKSLCKAKQESKGITAEGKKDFK